FEFVEAVEVNPAYALSTVVHEIWGHPEFNTPGGNYQLALWQKASKKIPGYTPDPGAEWRSFQYHETENYSLLRELPYCAAVSAKDAKFERLNPDPKKLVNNQIDNIEREWEPSLLAALLHGFYKRIALDPRIEKSALTAFENIIKTRYPAKAAVILK